MESNSTQATQKQFRAAVKQIFFFLSYFSISDHGRRKQVKVKSRLLRPFELGGRQIKTQPIWASFVSFVYLQQQQTSDECLEKKYERQFENNQQ